MKYINKKKLAFLVMLFLVGVLLLWEGIPYLLRQISGKAGNMRWLLRLETAASEQCIPMLMMLDEEKRGNRLEYRWDTQTAFVPWLVQIYEEGWEKRIRTQKNEVYRNLILEDDSTDYYALMQQENEELSEGGTKGEQEQRPVQDAENGAGPGQLSGQIENASEERAPDRDIDHYAMTRRREPVYEYDPEQLNDYEALIKSFYVIDQNTSAGPDELDAEVFMQKDYHVEKNTEGPVILIYHTHSQEGFADSVAGDPSTTVVGAGEMLAARLREYGYNVLHDTTSFDLESRDFAYSEALPYIEKLLEEYPAIQVVIDLHRDEMREDTHLVTNIDGRECARYMFFNGMSRLRKSGKIAYLENPFLQDNLGFSFQLQKASNEYYPGLSRKIYLKAYRYNLHLKPASVLIELGAQNNTVEEIFNACGPLSQVIDLVLSGKKE